jgi:hypothetical protein
MANAATSRQILNAVELSSFSAIEWPHYIIQAVAVEVRELEFSPIYAPF